MKIPLVVPALLALIVLQISCLSSNTLDSGSLFSGKEQTEPIGLEKWEGLTTLTPQDSTVAFSDTATILGINYQAIVTQEFVLYIIANQQDTVFAEADLPSHQEFRDFNGDGYQDLAVHHSGNGTDRMEMILFDTASRQFQLIINFSDYPAPKAIAGTPYFYSYNRSGCADQNWDLHLLSFNASQVVSLGHIAGKACEGEEIGIYVNRQQGNSLVLMEKFPMEILDGLQQNKWGFIEDYWEKNWGKFLTQQ